ncbi:hypothetical protein Scep_007985 [Stephania cephalantha]|uniref:DUF1677 family protein n=1 Tax=Stephania cephalantha TaxID=152367 RepID=A0AAP0PLM5_9MAGN
MAISGVDSASKVNNSNNGASASASAQQIIEVELAKCACCGLTEECTPTYIAKVRERYQGRWICGLCAEAVKDEIYRSERDIGTEEALNRHMNFFKKFRSASPPANPTKHLVSAMRQILRKSNAESPRVARSRSSGSSRRLGNEDEDRRGPSSLVRSESCLHALAG